MLFFLFISVLLSKNLQYLKMFFSHLAVYDSLKIYIGPHHRLAQTCKDLHAEYNFATGRSVRRVVEEQTTDFRKRVITVAALTVMQKNLLKIDVSRLPSLYSVVYGKTAMSIKESAFNSIKMHLAACVHTIYIDCQWIGYIEATKTNKDTWQINPMYPSQSLPNDAPFDFRTFQMEMIDQLNRWPNLKEITFFAPFKKGDPFISEVFAHARAATCAFKQSLPNPHHLEVHIMDDTTQIQCICDDLAQVMN